MIDAYFTNIENYDFPSVQSRVFVNDYVKVLQSLGMRDQKSIGSRILLLIVFLIKHKWRVFYDSAKLYVEMIKHKNKPFLTVTNELRCSCDGSR